MARTKRITPAVYYIAKDAAKKAGATPAAAEAAHLQRRVAPRASGAGPRQARQGHGRRPVRRSKIAFGRFVIVVWD